MEIGWLRLCRVCEKLQNYYHFRSKFRVRTDEARYLFQQFVAPNVERVDANRFNFIYELHRARRLKFTDQRDRVFAWLGHFSLLYANQDLRRLEANYHMTVAEVYIDLAKRALRGDKNTSDGTALISLGAVQHTVLPTSSESEAGKAVQPDEGEILPSWVPDWGVFRSFILSEPASPHSAHGSSVPKLEVYDDSPLLRIHCLKIDTIELCSRTLEAREFHIKSPIEPLGSTITYIWREICGQNGFDLSSTYTNGESSFFACMQTLSDGCVQISGREKMRYRDVPKSTWLEHGAMYLVDALGDSETVALDLRAIAQKARKEHEEDQWSRSANGATENRDFARTRQGYYVLGPGVMEVGDIVCVLFAGKLPFCLRPRKGHYISVGQCYVHGLMEGEAMRMADRWELIEKVFEIY